MNWNKWFRTALIGGSIVLLAACHSMHKNSYDPNAVNDANAAYNNGNGVQTAGLHRTGNFNDQVNRNGRSSTLVSNRIYYFDFDSNIVHDSDKPAIAANANYLIAHPNAKILLEGHTDPRGSREYNIGLGERRAKAVAELLRANGVSPSQIRIISYGAEKLALQGHTESAYEKDRRSVIAFLQS